MRVSKAALLAVVALVAIVCLANGYMLLSNHAGGTTRVGSPGDAARAESPIAPGVRVLPDHDRSIPPPLSR